MNQGNRERVTGTDRMGLALQAVLAGTAAALTVFAVLAIVRHSPSSSAAKLADEAGAASTAIPSSAILHTGIHSVRAAAPAGRGWVVLDPRKGGVHRLDARGARILEFGGPGRGPGELNAPAGLVVVGDTVLVVERSGERLHRFTLAGRHLDTRPALPPGCPGGGLVHAAAMGRTPILLFRCLDPARRGSHAAVYALDPDLRRLASLPLRRQGDGPVSPFLMPVLAADSAGFHLGVTTEPCLRTFDRNGEPRGEACHPWSEPVPLPAEERARLEVVRRRLGSGLGDRLEIPTVLPPFDGIFARGGRPVFRTVTGLEGRALDLLDADGLRRLPFPATPGTFVGDRSVLVTWEEIDGTWIRVYPFPS